MLHVLVVFWVLFSNNNYNYNVSLNDPYPKLFPLCRELKTKNFLNICPLSTKCLWTPYIFKHPVYRNQIWALNWTFFVVLVCWNIEIHLYGNHFFIKELADPTDVVLSKFQYLNLFVIVLWICEKLLEMCTQSKNEEFYMGYEFYRQYSTLLKYWKCVMCLECDRVGTMRFCSRI
jgi:hypothetical protein